MSTNAIQKQNAPMLKAPGSSSGPSGVAPIQKTMDQPGRATPGKMRPKPTGAAGKIAKSKKLSPGVKSKLIAKAAAKGSSKRQKPPVGKPAGSAMPLGSNPKAPATPPALLAKGIAYS